MNDDHWDDYEVVSHDGRIIKTHQKMNYEKAMSYKETFRDDFITGEVIDTTRRVDILDDRRLDFENMKQRELAILHDQLEKAEAKLAKITGKIERPEPEHPWLPPEDVISMTIAKSWFGFYSACITAVGVEVKRFSIRFYARNPYNAYLIARKACRTSKSHDYFLSTEIKFVGF